MSQNHGVSLAAETVDFRAEIQCGFKIGFRDGIGRREYDGGCHFFEREVLRQSSGE
jgi:hypothetical protein